MRFVKLACAALIAAMPNSALAQEATADLMEMAEKASVDVATAKDARNGAHGRPVLLLEEHHNSRELQLEAAICLVRLYSDAQMRDIALEGYLFEQDPIETRWYSEAADQDFGAKVRVAVQLLKEGEISAAEFAALVYDDCELYPIDKKAEYTDEPDWIAKGAPKNYLVRLGQLNLDESEEPFQKLLRESKTLVEALQEAEKGSDKALIEERRTVFSEKRTEVYDYVIKKDPWAWKTMQEIRADTHWSLSKRIRLYREIERRAVEAGAPLSGKEKEGMRALLAWYDARDKASMTMAVATAEVADLERPGPVAMILGAAHTQDVVDALATEKRPLVTITPNARTKGMGDIAMSMYKLKGGNRSLYAEGLSATLMDEFGTVEMKPRPVLMEPWFQAKAELYLLVDRVAHAVLGAPPPPGGGGEPPFGLSGDEFEGQRVLIDVSRIQLVPYGRREGESIYRLTEASLLQLQEAGFTSEEVGALGALKGHDYVGEESFLAEVRGAIGEERTEANRETVLEAALLQAVVFPVILNHRSQSKSKEIWAKAALSREAVSTEERADVEAMLMEALGEVAEDGILNETKVEDSGGRVQLSLDTLGAFDVSSDGVADISLGI